MSLGQSLCVCLRVDEAHETQMQDEVAGDPHLFIGIRNAPIKWLDLSAQALMQPILKPIPLGDYWRVIGSLSTPAIHLQLTV